MIWGMTLHPGEEFTRKVFGEEHLTLASLECRMSKYEVKGRPSACLLLKTNMREHVICTLEKGMMNQQCLDLVFEQGEKITFMAEGSGIIYLTGYTTKHEEEQSEVQGEPSVAIFIRDKEDEGEDDDNNDKMPDNQGDSNQDGKVLIKEENDSEDGMQDSEQGREETDDEPSTTGHPGPADGGDMEYHNHGSTLQGNGEVKGDDNSGGFHGDCIQGNASSAHGDVSGYNADYRVENKDDENSGDGKNLHGDGIHGNGIQDDGNSSDHIDDLQVHLSVVGIPSDGDSMYDRDEDDIMDKLDEERDADGEEGNDDGCNHDNQEGEEGEIIDTFCQEKQEKSINLVLTGIEDAVMGIQDVSHEKENCDISSKFENLRSFTKPVKKSKNGSTKYKYCRCKCGLENFSGKRLHQTHGVKRKVDPKRKHHLKKYGKVSLRCEYFGKAFEYKCEEERHKISPLGVKHYPFNILKGKEIKLI